VLANSYGSIDQRDRRAIPTRRSSDLLHTGAQFEIDRTVQPLDRRCGAEDGIRHGHLERGQQVVPLAAEDRMRSNGDLDVQVAVRSEEHTSELQSRENLVCRLLLETK